MSAAKGKQEVVTGFKSRKQVQEESKAQKSK